MGPKTGSWVTNGYIITAGNNRWKLGEVALFTLGCLFTFLLLSLTGVRGVVITVHVHVMYTVYI